MAHIARLPLTPPGGKTYRLTGCTLIDGNGGPPIADAQIRVANDRIVYAGPATQAPRDTGPDVTTIALEGRTILPGFIDAHVHFGLVVEDLASDRMRFDSERAIRTAVLARKTLMAGVTTARDLGGVDAGLRDAISQGLVLGPRLHIAISILSPTGGHADFHFANGCCTGVHMPIDPVVDSDDELRKRVRLLVRSGADLIKICSSGGVSSPTDDPEDVGLTARQVQIINEEMDKRAGQPVASHAQGRRGILEAVRGGVRSVEHGYEIDEEIIELMVQNNTFLVPTLSSALRLPPDPSLVPDYLYRKKVKWSALARKHVSGAIADHRLKIAMGTDAGVCPHGINLTELAHYADLGMNPMAAIQTGTRNAAQLLRLEHELGTLEAGKLADLVIVDFDPIANIHGLAKPDNIKVVIQGGAVVKDLENWTGLPARRSALG